MSKLLQPECATNPIVFFDICIGKEFAGRMIIELRKDVVPRTAENFRALCTGEKGFGQLGKRLHYKGIRFHKVTRVYVAQSGDVINNDGTSGESIYGPTFDDENFKLNHEEGVVSMTNYGKPNTNNSQFVITSMACNNLDKTNVVVGKVLRGLSIINDMEQIVDDDGNPNEEIIITNCGEILHDQKWCIEDNDETDDKLPPYPQDWEYDKESFTSDQMVSILTGIRQSGNHFYALQSFHEAMRKYRKANRYYVLLRRNFEYQELEQYASQSEDLKKLDKFAVINNINFAAVSLKLKQYENAKYYCTEAIRLDDNCSKAYYRRAQASLNLKNFEDAIGDFEKAHLILPSNKQILNDLNFAKKLLSDYNRNQMNALKKLFN